MTVEKAVLRVRGSATCSPFQFELDWAESFWATIHLGRGKTIALGVRRGSPDRSPLFPVAAARLFSPPPPLQLRDRNARPDLANGAEARPSSFFSLQEGFWAVEKKFSRLGSCPWEGRRLGPPSPAPVGAALLCRVDGAQRSKK